MTLDGVTGDVLSFLPNFPNLTHLTFVSSYGQIGDVNVFDISAISPTLRSIKFNSSYILDLDQRLDTILAVERQQTTWNTTNNNIQELDIEIPNLSKKIIDLITRYSSTQLKSISITLDEIDMYDWVEQVG